MLAIDGRRRVGGFGKRLSRPERATNPIVTPRVRVHVGRTIRRRQATKTAARYLNGWYMKISDDFWTEPDVPSRSGCTPTELVEIRSLTSTSLTSAVESRRMRFVVGDWLLAKYGKAGLASKDNLPQIAALAEELGLSVTRLSRSRLVACRWQGEARRRVLDSPVFVCFTVLYLAAAGTVRTPGEAADLEFGRRAGALFTAMDAVQAGGVMEVTEPVYLKAVAQAQVPSRQPGAEASQRAAARTLLAYENQPEVREAVLEKVKADADAQRAIAASYVMSRPGLARAVLREDPDLAEVAARQTAQARPDGENPSGHDLDALHDLVQLMGQPAPSPELELCEWREDFSHALTRLQKFFAEWYPAAVVGDRIDEHLAHTVAALHSDVADWASTITTMRGSGLRLVGSHAG
ncbi:hypothetical protein [Streptomyces sp. NPDC049949]|uniref:hypothetical protein n=1 Tax=Streptomyces sp. NPDC049949 TaxID=3154627 RepID=UPI003423E524